MPNSLLHGSPSVLQLQVPNTYKIKVACPPMNIPLQQLSWMSQTCSFSYLPLLARCLHAACTHKHSQFAGNKEHAQRSHTADKFFHCCTADLDILQQRNKMKNRRAWLTNSHVSGPEINIREMMYWPRRSTLFGVVLQTSHMQLAQNLFFCAAHMDAKDQPIVDAKSAERQPHELCLHLLLCCARSCQAKSHSVQTGGPSHWFLTSEIHMPNRTQHKR